MAMAAHRAVGAVVAALLSAVTEPVVNNMLGTTFPDGGCKNFGSHEDHKVLADHPGDEFHEHFEKQHICQYQKTKLSSSDRKTGCGIDFFCDPAGHRFRKLNLPTSKNLYPFGPTVLRDIIYGSVRKKVLVLLTNLHPTLGSTVMGRVVSMYATVVTAWVVSSPLNELRGYYLQPQDRKQSFASFF